MTKYTPCTHCVGQDCKICDYGVHKKAIGKIKCHTDNLKSLRNHFKSYTDDDVFKQDFETVTDVLEALELVE